MNLDKVECKIIVNDLKIEKRYKLNNIEQAERNKKFYNGYLKEFPEMCEVSIGRMDKIIKKEVV